MEHCFISHICRLRPCRLFVKTEAVGLSDLKTTTPQQPKSGRNAWIHKCCGSLYKTGVKTIQSKLKCGQEAVKHRGEAVK